MKVATKLYVGLANRVISSNSKSNSIYRNEVQIFVFEKRTLTVLNTVEEGSEERATNHRSVSPGPDDMC